MCLTAYPADPQLGVWCHNQRSLARKGRLAAERIARLNALGFSWEPNDALWEEMYQRLVAYRAGHGGDCNVPQDYPADLDSAFGAAISGTSGGEVSLLRSEYPVWMRWGSCGSRSTPHGTKCTSGSLPTRV